MSVIVLSGGRTGTNMALEMLRGSSKLVATMNVHDEQTVKKGNKVHSRYLSKADLDSLIWPEISRFLKNNPEMKVIFTVRHPYDTMMSKIYRGQPNTEGRGDWFADDAHPETCFSSMQWMKEVHRSLMEHFPDRTLVIKMEDMILDTENTCKKMCDHAGIPYSKTLCNFPNRMRNKHKHRYKEIDKSQVDLYKRVDEVYDGFFTTYKHDIKELFESVNGLVEYYGYTTN